MFLQKIQDLWWAGRTKARGWEDKSEGLGGQTQGSPVVIVTPQSRCSSTSEAGAGDAASRESLTWDAPLPAEKRLRAPSESVRKSL